MQTTPEAFTANRRSSPRLTTDLVDHLRRELAAAHRKIQSLQAENARLVQALPWTVRL